MWREIWPVCPPGHILLSQAALWKSDSSTECGDEPVGLLGEMLLQQRLG